MCVCGGGGGGTRSGEAVDTPGPGFLSWQFIILGQVSNYYSSVDTTCYISVWGGWWGWGWGGGVLDHEKLFTNYLAQASFADGLISLVQVGTPTLIFISLCGGGGGGGGGGSYLIIVCVCCWGGGGGVNYCNTRSEVPCTLPGPDMYPLLAV